jgi:hypothetical protein
MSTEIHLPLLPARKRSPQNKLPDLLETIRLFIEVRFVSLTLTGLVCLCAPRFERREEW